MLTNEQWTDLYEAVSANKTIPPEAVFVGLHYMGGLSGVLRGVFAVPPNELYSTNLEGTDIQQVVLNHFTQGMLDAMFERAKG